MIGSAHRMTSAPAGRGRLNRHFSEFFPFFLFFNSLLYQPLWMEEQRGAVRPGDLARAVL
jgi:hypothetical protein